jgi:hypothetical protein
LRYHMETIPPQEKKYNESFIHKVFYLINTNEDVTKIFS